MVSIFSFVYVVVCHLLHPGYKASPALCVPWIFFFFFYVKSNISNLNSKYPKIKFFKCHSLVYFEWLSGVFYYNGVVFYFKATVWESNARAHYFDFWPLIGSCTCQSNMGGVRGSSSSERAEATELSNTNNRLKYYPGGTKTSFFYHCGNKNGINRLRVTLTIRPLNFNIVATKNFLFCGESYLCAWLEFCWQTSQSVC